MGDEFGGLSHPPVSVPVMKSDLEARMDRADQQMVELRLMVDDLADRLQMVAEATLRLVTRRGDATFPVE